MKKLALLCLVLSGCMNGYERISTEDCKKMCLPQAVLRLDKDGCFCQGGAIAEKAP